MLYEVEVEHNFLQNKLISTANLRRVTMNIKLHLYENTLNRTSLPYLSDKDT